MRNATNNLKVGLSVVSAETTAHREMMMKLYAGMYNRVVSMLKNGASKEEAFDMMITECSVDGRYTMKMVNDLRALINIW